MTTLCPNCSRPARKGALYCGFCGTNLNSTGAIAQALPAGASKERNKKNPKVVKQGKKRDFGKTAAVIAIILLVLIILTALLAQNWVEVLTFLLTSIYNLFAK